VIWLRRQDPARSKALAAALYRAYFVDGIDISSPDATADVAARAGLDRAALRAALDDPDVKQALVAENDEAMRRGVFGSPFVIIDGEPFWGTDRFAQMDRWLATGGF
jgi:2-hydroxychromene-2-carboxylate isomerase